MAQVKLSPPWIIYYNELKAFFKYDSEVKIIYDEDESEIKLYVFTTEKAAALSRLLPSEKVFGNVRLKVSVLYPNTVKIDTVKFHSNVELLEAALKENPILAYCSSMELFSNPIVYVVFEPEIVQYFTDNLGDYFGLHSTLYQEIAKDIFTSLSGVFYCTDIGPTINQAPEDIFNREWP